MRVAGEYRVAASGSWHECTVRDVSGSGAAILTDEPIPLQSSVALRFTLRPRGPSAGPVVSAETLVVRSGQRAPDDPSRPHLAGLYFLDLLGEPREQLRRYVWNALADPQ